MRRMSLVWLTAILSSVSIGYGTSAKAEVIYQAFNERFTDVETKLSELASIGYSHIQVSPPQKSINFNQWWARYQPVDLRVIDSPLGSERSTALDRYGAC